VIPTVSLMQAILALVGPNSQEGLTGGTGKGGLGVGGHALVSGYPEHTTIQP